jgi:hypothetical protein
MQRRFGLTSKLSILLLLSSALSVSSASTNGPVSSQGKPEVDKQEQIETISVVGERSMLYFRHQMQDAEFDFYVAYNALADNEKFIMLCNRENILGSRIRVKVCLPRYVRDRMAQETQNAIFLSGVYPKLSEIEFAVREEREESMAYVESVVTENPELLAKLVMLNKKKMQYAQAKKNKKARRTVE